MNIRNTAYNSLIIWIVTIISIGFVIGTLTKPQINSWYSLLNRAALTPPNYVFPFVWSILYGMIGACGWFIWRISFFANISLIKILYMSQLILNWSWTPLFFHYHCTGISFVVLCIIAIVVIAIIFMAYKNMKIVSLFMMPYLAWLLFASYLNFYVWFYN